MSIKILPYMLCVTPTYKRPELLRNLLACYRAQDYPKERRRLFIYDDANQFRSKQCGDDWELISTENREPSLPAKFNAMVKWALSECPEPDTSKQIIVIQEDDDVYTPNHLSEIAKAHQQHGPGYYIPDEHVWSNYGENRKAIHIEKSAGRFHSSWAFSVELFNRVGGYDEEFTLMFDQNLGSKLTQAAPPIPYGNSRKPSFSYRWGNPSYHGSQSGDQGFRQLWDALGSLPAPKQGSLAPEFDEETIRIYKDLGFEV